jgi:predicted TIM-barrel fold metal-dependent hydrolase
MIIDAHCHAGKGAGLTGPWDTRADLGPYLRRARAAGIDRTVLVPPLTTNYAAANAQLARLAASSPHRFVCFAGLSPRRDAGRILDMVGQAVNQWGFKGIKVHRIDGQATREVCEAAREWRLPLLYDVMDRPYLVELLASEYPDVHFIMPHLGSFADDWRVHLQVIDQLVRLPNVYADTSGVRRFDYIVQSIRRAGAHKVLFGSDGPWLHPGLELHKIRLLGLPPAQERLVLGGNLLRLIGGSATLAPPIQRFAAGAGCQASALEAITPASRRAWRTLSGAFRR